MVGQTALPGELADDLPGELARRGVAVLPAIHGRDGDCDGVRELLLREAELAPEAADHVAGVDVHAVRLHGNVLMSAAMSCVRGSNRRATHRPSLPGAPAFEGGGACARRARDAWRSHRDAAGGRAAAARTPGAGDGREQPRG